MKSWWNYTIQNQTYNFQLCFGDSANAVGSKIGVSGLDATQATEIFVALFFPLGNQVLVCIAFLYAVIIQLCQETHKEWNWSCALTYTTETRIDVDEQQTYDYFFLIKYLESCTFLNLLHTTKTDIKWSVLYCKHSISLYFHSMMSLISRPSVK